MINGTALLQIFVLVDVFFMGALVAVALRHAYAHFHPLEHEPEKPRAQATNRNMPPALRERLQEEAEANFEHVMGKATKQLTQDLTATEGRLTQQLEKLGSELVRKEMDRYHEELDSLRKRAEAAENGAQDQLTQHQTELQAKMAEEVTAEKQRLLQQIDTKLADAVASFLTETLQHNVDLGAQASYLVAQLEEHKADFKREVADEAHAPK